MTKAKNGNSEKQLLAFLNKRKKEISPLLILMHDYPDPDALAGAYALQYLVSHAFGMQARIVYRGAIGRAENRNMVQILKLPIHPLRQADFSRYAHIALVDTQPAFENNPFPSNRKPVLVIDQHPSATKFDADFSIIDTACGATCIIIAKAIIAAKLEIPERLATALTYGIITDTMDLYRARRPDIVETYLAVLPYANMRALARIQTPIREKKFFSSVRKAINDARIIRGLLVCHHGEIPGPEVISESADFLLTYKKAQWVLATGRFGNKLCASFRTKKTEVPAAKLLRACFENPDDAGGHGCIAAGTTRVNVETQGAWTKAEKKVEENMIKALKRGRKDKPKNAF